MGRCLRSSGWWGWQMERHGTWLRRVRATLPGALLLTVAGGSANAVEKAEAAQGPPLHIALFVSSRNDLCYDTGDISAIKRFAAYQQRQINLRGGIAGRPLKFRILDDQRSEAKAIAN